MKHLPAMSGTLAQVTYNDAFLCLSIKKSTHTMRGVSLIFTKVNTFFFIPSLLKDRQACEHRHTNLLTNYVTLQHQARLTIKANNIDGGRFCMLENRSSPFRVMRQQVVSRIAIPKRILHMNMFLRRGGIGLLAGAISCVILGLTLHAGLTAFLLGMFVGGVYALAFRPTP